MRTMSLLLSVLFLTPALCNESPDVKVDQLVQALTSFNWSWENTDGGKKSFEEIQFYQGGIADNPKFFTARWEPTGPRTITLYNTNRIIGQNGKRAYLVFDAAFTRFIGIDFNGRTNVEGFRRESLDPKRPAPEARKRPTEGN